jgi:hypothetical protein
MIIFMKVDGQVLVEDKKKQTRQLATSGMQLLSDQGNYLIASTQSSSAELLVNGKTFFLKPSSFIRVRGDRSWWDRHSEMWCHDLRLFSGRLWTKVQAAAGNDEEARWRKEEANTPNSVVGIRG